MEREVKVKDRNSEIIVQQAAHSRAERIESTNQVQLQVFLWGILCLSYLTGYENPLRSIEPLRIVVRQAHFEKVFDLSTAYFPW